jgi:DNA-binding HxlR family transcriptional regulator
MRLAAYKSNPNTVNPLFAIFSIYTSHLDERLELDYSDSVPAFDCILAMKALGDENRLRIIRFLLQGKHSVNEIVEEVGLTQYKVSKDLRILREAGLLQQEKLRQQRLYSLAKPFSQHLEENCHILNLGCCQFDFNQLPG